MDRFPEEAPPLVVGVVGPPGVGKTTLIKSLIRRYTKQTLTAPTGPLTVVTSKRRRLTFMECPSDSLASMIDMTKIVDIVLLLIDGHYGFEMETMEFLNSLAASGMPGNVFGILTHLDMFRKQDTLRTRKKQLKQRFWSELYQGAKLFYLSGVINGRYPDREVLNISRFLSVMKNPRPLVWRNSHHYCLADRFLDVTPPTDIEQNPKCDRQIALYGYLRGTNFPAQDAKVHVPGVGDLDVSEIEALPDPCPTPFIDQQIAKVTGHAKRKRLGEKQKLLFAPMSDVGGVLVDKDAVYIDIKKPTFDLNAEQFQTRGIGEQMVMDLQGDRRLLGQGDANMRLFGDQTFVGNSIQDQNQNEPGQRKKQNTISPIENKQEDLIDEAYVSGLTSENESVNDDVSRRAEILLHKEGDQDDNGEEDSEISFEDSDSDGLNGLEENDQGGLKWKNDLREKAKSLHIDRRVRQTRDLVRMMYDTSISTTNLIKEWNRQGPVEDLEVEFLERNDELFQQKSQEDIDEDLRPIPRFDFSTLEEKWGTDDSLEALASRFTSARTNVERTKSSSSDEENDSAFEDSEDGGGFQDLEEPTVNDGKQADYEDPRSMEEAREQNAKKREELKLRFETEDAEGNANENAQNKADASQSTFGEDDWYDAQKAAFQKQLEINRSELSTLDDTSRIRVEGHKAGTYARLVLNNVPFEFARNFSSRFPIILGGLNPTETRFGFLQVRIKRHRWHSRILKNNDPLTFSLGWRRFQSVPLYHLSDSRTRNRMLKYTPQHMHCFATFYGPLIAPNTGFCAVQSFSNRNSGFRIAASGVVQSVDESTEIVKKLKLKGYPHKVFKNTAIIRDMFASDLEIAKFKAGNLRTVSGIRGMVKGRAGAQYPEGYIRAGFEDKILKSDIVFLSAWMTVKPREFYMPVTDLIEDPEDTGEWRGMRTTGQIRNEDNIPIPQSKDSFYRSVERSERHFNPLRVPKKLAEELPFKSQIARMKPQNKETYLQKRAVVLGGEEKKARDLMQKLFTLRNEKVAKRQLAQEKRKEPHRKKVAENLEKKATREKREKEAYWKKEGRKRKDPDDNGMHANKKRKYSR